ncbi:AtpZ/AtpI family protein [Agilicoccus flavus]|uniref:AtpZ/AtpI family protein n=1 Tax=Agilicoccus flavus TaxID=2775968 RepID=UPI001CF700EA|nr:AtpZ/AtpI family protein [Agilicoccus flavus]
MSAHTPREGDGTLRRSYSRGESIGGTVSAYLIAGPVAYGALGWGLDRWLDTVFLTPLGLLLGMALALYVVWLRYGKS